MSSELRSSLRRLIADRRSARLAATLPKDLSFWDTQSPLPGKVLLDTTVYVDILQRRFPIEADRFLRTADAWHSPITAAEMATTCTLLNPDHPGTAGVISVIDQSLKDRPPQRTLVPDQQTWIDAGLLCGLLVRIQGLTKTDRRRLLNDALLLETARKHGIAVLTRNINDFDMLQQLEPSAQVLFYEPA